MKGVYVWQSGTAQIPDAEDGKRKIGVQLTPIIDFITTYKGKIYLRRLRLHFAEDSIENNTTMVNINITDLNDGGVGSKTKENKIISAIPNTHATTYTNTNINTSRFINTFSYTFGYIYSGYNILKYFFYKNTYIMQGYVCIYTLIRIKHCTILVLHWITPRQSKYYDLTQDSRSKRN